MEREKDRGGGERERAHERHKPELYQASDPFVGGESETWSREACSKLSCHA